MSYSSLFAGREKYVKCGSLTHVQYCRTVTDRHLQMTDRTIRKISRNTREQCYDWSDPYDPSTVAHTERASHYNIHLTSGHSVTIRTIRKDRTKRQPRLRSVC